MLFGGVDFKPNLGYRAHFEAGVEDLLDGVDFLVNYFDNLIGCVFWVNGDHDVHIFQGGGDFNPRDCNQDIVKFNFPLEYFPDFVSE